MSVAVGPLPASIVELLECKAALSSACEAYTATPSLCDGVALADPEFAPGVDVPALLLAVENQGVCCWVVPLGAGDDPPVLVAGDLVGGPGAVRYADSVRAFVDAWTWDRALLEHEPLVQAQAAPLSGETVAWLDRGLTARWSSWGWPTQRVLRYEGDGGVRLMVWDGDDQCDWWVSADDAAACEALVRRLLPHSDLASSFWSNDDAGIGSVASPVLRAKGDLGGHFSHGKCM